MEVAVRIAQVAPLYESVPPRKYGGTERAVSFLTEELVRQGHEVTLFASGDSRTRARLVPACPRSLRTDAGSRDPLLPHLKMLEAVSRQAALFDVIHFHTDWLHLPFCRRDRLPAVMTLHARLDEVAGDLPREYAQVPAISISHAQRTPLPWLTWAATIFHGLPDDLFTPTTRPDRTLAFIGRTSPEKGLDRAIRIARRAGLPLVAAAKVNEAERSYFERTIEPELSRGVLWLGEVGDTEKNVILGNARALLFPIEWPEPFGLVMIEALACGTPVIAFNRGSVPEIIEHGVTGFIVEDEDGAVEAVRRLGEIDRARCRRAFLERFSVRRMVADHLSLYRRFAAGARGGIENPWAT